MFAADKRRSFLWIWVCSMCWALPVFADGAAHPAERVEYLIGAVVNAHTKKPVAYASVQAFGNGRVMATAVASAKGLFALGPLPVEGANLPDSYLVTAKATGFFGVSVTVEPTREKSISLSLSQGKPLSVHLVDSDGQPAKGVRVTVKSFEAEKGKGNRVEASSLSDPNQLQAQSDDMGVALFPSLPESGVVELRTSAASGFSGDIFFVTLPSDDKPHRLPRESIAKGHVLLGKDRPLYVPGLQVKAQGWTYPWSDYEQWRIGKIAPDGSFELDNLPALESLNEPTYGLNLDMPGLGYGEEKEFAPGVKVGYVGGWNLMVTITKDGHTERWISYVEALDGGLKYAEGAHFDHDMVLEPLALLKGQLPASVLKKGREVSYNPPRSIYGSWSVSADEQGRFEIPVTIGETKVSFPDGERTFAELKAQEVRVVDFATALPTTPASPQRR